MTVIKYILFIRARGEIEPRLFVESFFVAFLRSVSSFHPSMVRLIFFVAWLCLISSEVKRRSRVESEVMVTLPT